MTTERVTAADAGCWIDGHWGQYGGDRLIEIASGYGWEPDDEEAKTLLDFSLFRLSHIGPSMGKDQEEYLSLLRRILALGIDDDALEENEWQAFESQSWLIDEIEIWMNENIAPEGYHFMWEDGEFMLLEDLDEEDDA